MRVRTFCVSTVALAVSACATGGMIPGTIYSSSGKTLQFEIEKARRTGAVRALDPSTGERFEGTYVGIMERVSGSATTFASASGTTGHLNSRATASGFGSASVGSNIANATAFLKGDQGTMLTCAMQIEAGFSPHGIGGCDDNKGGTYKLQF